jgi:TolB-like protein/tetratricopeptide (TPR) repeat protein
VVSRCLHKEAERRYQSAGEVLSALEALRSTAVAAGSGPATPPPEPGPPEPWKPTWRHAVYGALATLLLVALVLLWPQPPRRHDPAVVVLPARNESGGSEQQYLADGLTDQLINSFAVLAHLRVLSRMTGDAMARKPEPLPAAARHYGFDYALETAVVRVGDRLRVHARLVDARSDRPIWVESYDREVAQIVTVDNEIVLGIVQKLKTPFSNTEAALLGTARPVDPAAFQAFTRGRTAVMERHYQPALDLFLEAARIDSTYASAYAGLADCYTEMAYYREMDPGEALSRAVAAADRALTLDSAQADAHLAKALVYGLLWNWAGAAQELRNAEADAPGSAQLHYRLSLYDGVMGRVDDAVRELERAAQLDPASPRMASELGLAYLNARKLDKAEREFERVMAWNDGTELKRSRAYHARCPAHTGGARVAVTELTAAAGAHPEVFEREELAYALAAAGRAAESRRIVAELLAMGPGVASPLAIAAAQLTAGSRDAALETLLRACDQHDPKLLWLAVDQRFDPIRREPKYDMMIRAMGLDKPPPA